MTMLAWASPKMQFPGAKTLSTGLDAEAKILVRLLDLDTNPERRKQQVEEAVAHLDSLSHYTYTEGWSSANATTPGATITLKDVDAKLIEENGNELSLSLRAAVLKNGVGKLEIAPLPHWIFEFDGSEANGVQLTSLLPENPEKFRFNPTFGGTLTEGLSVEFDADGILGSIDPTQWNERVNSLSLSGKIPLYDQKFAGSDTRRTTASDIDLLILSFDSYGYRKGGWLDSFGIRGRMPSGGKGGEVVAYHGLLGTGWKSSKAKFGVASYTFASDLELGARSGDVEWSNLRTSPESTGNVVARIGTLLEFWPRIGPLNSNIGQGLNFYVRGRFWLDYAEIDSDAITRGRGFVDSEFFFPIGDEFRVFVRYEGGMLPPNLSTYTNRLFLGVGAKF